jgi:hypothetical protein
VPIVAKTSSHPRWRKTSANTISAITKTRKNSRKLSLTIIIRTITHNASILGFTMSYLERTIADGHAKISGEGKQQKILYVAVKGDPNNDLQPVRKTSINLGRPCAGKPFRV